MSLIPLCTAVQIPVADLMFRLALCTDYSIMILPNTSYFIFMTPPYIIVPVLQTRKEGGRHRVTCLNHSSELLHLKVSPLLTSVACGLSESILCRFVAAIRGGIGSSHKNLFWSHIWAQRHCGGWGSGSWNRLRSPLSRTKMEFWSSP